MSALEILKEKQLTLHHLQHATQYLSWDESVMMPVGGGNARANSLAKLQQIAHNLATSSEIGDLIEAAKEEASSPWDQANLRVIEQNWQRATVIPEDLVVRMSLATSKCTQVWREKRKENDWVAVVPLLEEVVNLTKERATIISELFNVNLYEALLGGYERGITTDFVDTVFDDLASFLPDFVNEVIERQPAHLPLKGEYSDKDQKQLAEELMLSLGFNFERGRLDTSHHPFSCGERWDTRITTRFGADDFLESMYATLHETGHALYQQGLPAEHADQPVGKSLGMMVHESQSLFMEQQVCRSDGYIKFALPIVKKCLAKEDNKELWSFTNFIRNVRHVDKGKIRVQADECTYPLHVILRYRIEQAFLSGDLKVVDIPDAWNELMHEFFGLNLEGDFADGCMQDIHWFMGAIGYFPCYTLGAITAAQLYQKYQNTFPAVEVDFENGQFDQVLDWLRKNVHSQGQLTPAFERIQEVTGRPLSTAAFKQHVTGRYLDSLLS